MRIYKILMFLLVGSTVARMNNHGVHKNLTLGDFNGKKALIFGVTGQDGAYLANLLLSKGYEVHGVKRRTSVICTDRIDHLYLDPHLKNSDRFQLHYGDLIDNGNILDVIRDVEPDEIYNLAAQSHVRVSFDLPGYTAEVTGLGTLRILEAIRLLGWAKKVKFYQASSSEMFGKVHEVPQTELTPFHPRSPYGVSQNFLRIGLLETIGNHMACLQSMASCLIMNHQFVEKHL